MWDYVAIGVGSALGGAARYWCSGAVAHRFGERFPWGTLVVNVLGSFVIGFFAGLGAVDPAVRRFATIGFCGGYTTFSSFSLQTLALARDGDRRPAAGNVAASVLLCLAAAWLGHAAAAALALTEGP